ncbi:eukaryotic translation initiation factor eIF1-like [Lineus longissimus]|uniref:eukaryotic translation initiation factor eIF1-like n=1 Tax=Lineus longissimus TaxID=88925 RepID=UPI002B4FB45B
MSIQNFKSSDPFALEGASNSTNAAGIIHIRLQQRNGRKTLTTVAGLVVRHVKHEKAVLQKWKKEFCCNGTIIHDKGETVFQLQGDHCEDIMKFLISEEMATKNQIKVHGWK